MCGGREECEQQQEKEGRGRAEKEKGGGGKNKVRGLYECVGGVGGVSSVAGEARGVLAARGALPS